MEMLRTLVPVEVRELGDRVLEIAGSTEDVDRMGDIIKSKGWQLAPFKKNPVFMWVHDYSQPPIGRALKVWVDKETKRLMFNIEFADAATYEFADTIYKLYKGGFLHATSVGFIPLDWEGKDDENPYPKWENNVFTKQELLELSAAPVPANPNALVTARDQGLITVKEFEAVTKQQEGGIVTNPALGLLSAESQRQALKLDAEIMAIVDKPEETDELESSEPPKPQPQQVGQAQILDDIAYVQATIEREGLSDEAVPAALDLASEIIRRSLGNDIPIEILDKVGAVLNAKNKGRLTQIQELAQAVLDSAVTADDDSDKQLEVIVPTPTAAELTRERALYVAEVTQLVIAKLQGKRQN